MSLLTSGAQLRSLEQRSQYIDKKAKEAYDSLTEKEKQLVEIDRQANPDNYRYIGSTIQDDNIYKAAHEVKGLDPYIREEDLEPFENGVFNAIDDSWEDGINKIWQEAYDGMGVLKNFLRINSTGNPSEETYADENSLGNLAYRKYKQRVNEITERYEKEAQEKEWENRLYQYNGVVDEGKTRAFQELSAEEKAIVDSFGDDTYPSKASSAQELEIYNNWLNKAKAYNEQGVVDELMQRYAEGLSLSNSDYDSGNIFDRWLNKPEVQTQSVALSSAEVDELSSKYNLSQDEVRELVRKVNNDPDFRAEQNQKVIEQMQAHKASEAYQRQQQEIANGILFDQQVRAQFEDRKAAASREKQSSDIRLSAPAAVFAATMQGVSDATYDIIRFARDMYKSGVYDKVVPDGEPSNFWQKEVAFWFEELDYMVRQAETVQGDTTELVQEQSQSVQTIASVAQETGHILGITAYSKAFGGFMGAAGKYVMLPKKAATAAKAVSSVSSAIKKAGEVVAQHSKWLKPLGTVMQNVPSGAQALPFTIAAYAGAAKEAEQEGYSFEDQVKYGLFIGVTTGPLDALLSLMSLETGAAAISKNILRRVVTTGSKTGTKAFWASFGTSAFEMIANAVAEGTEEVGENYWGELGKKWILGSEYESPSLQENAASFGMGFAVSLILGGFGLGGEARTKANTIMQLSEAGLPITDAQLQDLYDTVEETLKNTPMTAEDVAALEEDMKKGAVMASAEEVRAVKNSVEEKAKATTELETARQAMVDVVSKSGPIGNNVLVAATARLKAAQNKYVQTSQALDAAQAKFYESEATNKARADQEVRKRREEAFQAEAEEQARRSEAAEARMPQELRVAIKAIESGNTQINDNMIRIAMESSVAQEQAQVLSLAYAELQTAQTALQEVLSGIETYTIRGSARRVAKLRALLPDLEARVEQAHSRLQTAANGFAQAARATFSDQATWEQAFNEADRENAHTILFGEPAISVQTQQTLQPETEAAQSVTTDQAQAKKPGNARQADAIVNADGSMNVGKVTVIKKPYHGDVPQYGEDFDPDSLETVTVSEEDIQQARNLFAQAEETAKNGGRSFIAELRRLYGEIIGERYSGIRVEVEGLEADGQQYEVTLNKSVIKKVLSEKVTGPEKYALLPKLPSLIENSLYVGSGEYAPSKKSAKYVQRYDYFEVPVMMDGREQIVRFDVEVRQDLNRFRTYKINEINLPSMETVPGPTPGGPSDAAGYLDLNPVAQTALLQQRRGGPTDQVHLSDQSQPVASRSSDPDTSISNSPGNVNESSMENSDVQAYIDPAFRRTKADERLSEIMQEDAAAAPETEERTGTYVGDDGVRRSVTTGSMLDFLVSSNYTSKGKLRRFNDIVKSLSDTLGMGYYENRRVIKSHIPKAEGAYLKKKNSVMVQRANDYNVFFHEMGHRLDEEYNLSALPGVDKVIDVLPDGFKAAYDESQWVGEAVAEAVNMYMFAPESARALWPEFVETIETRVAQDNPKGYRAIKAASNDLIRLSHASTDERINATIKSHRQTVGETVKDFGTALMQNKGEAITVALFDYLAPLERVDTLAKKSVPVDFEDSVYVTATNNLMSSRIAEGLIRDRLVDANYQQIGDGKSLVDCFKGLSQEEQEGMDAYLKYLRAIDEEGRGAVLPKSVSLDDAKARVQEIEANHPNMKAAADNLFQWWKDFGQAWLVNEGYVSQKEWDEWVRKRPHYTPIQRVMYREDGRRDTSGSTNGASNAGAVAKRFRGDTRDTYSSLESVILKVADIVQLVKNGEVLRKLDDLYESAEGMGQIMTRIDEPRVLQSVSSDPVFQKLNAELNKQVKEGKLDKAQAEDLFEAMQERIGASVEGMVHKVGDMDVIAVRTKSGEVHYYDVADAAVLDALRGLDKNRNNELAKVIGAYTHMKAALTTALNPIFAMTNVPRDVQEAYATGENHNPVSFAGNWFKSAGTTLKGDKSQDPNYLLYRAMGGAGGITSSVASSKAMKELIGEALPDTQNQILRAAKAMQENMLKVTEATEAATRYQAFDRVLKRGGTPAEAMYAAQNVTTNFNRRGRWTNQVSPLVVFFNATCQGLYKTTRILNGKDFRTADGKIDGKKLGGVISSVFLNTALGAALQELLCGLLDDEYENLSESMKDNYWIIPAGGGGKFVRIAKPNSVLLKTASSFGRHAVTAARELMEGDSAEEKFDGATRELLKIFTDTLDAVTPFGTSEGGGIGSNGIWSTYLDLHNNKTWYGGEIVPQSMIDQGVQPQNQYDSSTSEIGKLVGSITGCSPMKVDYFIDQELGGIGDVLLPLTTVGEDWDAMDAASAVWNVIRNKVTADARYSTDVLSNFYDSIDEMNEITKNANLAKGYDKFSKGMSENDIQNAADEAQSLLQDLYEYRELLYSLNDEIDELEGSGLTRRDEKVRAKRLEQIETAWDALELVAQYREKWYQ